MLGTLVPKELKPLRGVSVAWLLPTDSTLSDLGKCSCMMSISAFSAQNCSTRKRATAAAYDTTISGAGRVGFL